MWDRPESFDALAEGYDFMSALESSRYDLFLDNLPVERFRALDIGCGTGGLAFELSKHFQSVLAIDISAPMLEIARRKHNASNIEYQLLDANGLNTSLKFDYIVSQNTFHHLSDVPATLGILRNALNPDGKLVITDCICETLKVPKYVIFISPFLDFLPDWRRHSFHVAARLFRFRMSRPWRAHLASDTFLSESGFHEVYGKALPPATFIRHGNFMTVAWTKSQI